MHLAFNEDNISINQYFADNPEMILGNMVMESTAFGFDSACKAFEGEDLVITSYSIHYTKLYEA